MKYLFIFSYPLLLVMLISCSNEKVQSSWTENGIIVDGLGNDWNNLSLTYNEDLKIAYGFANNDSSLYFMIRFRDRNLIRMFSRRGMTLWLNDKDKKNKKLGIHYIDDTIQPMMTAMHRNSTQNQRDNQPVFIPSGIFTLARNDSADLDIKIDNITEMQAATKYEDGFYCFEFSIPVIKTINFQHFLTIPKNKKIKACFEINPMSQEDKERMQEMMAVQRNSAGGGRNGGMKGGGGGRSGGGMKGGGGMSGGRGGMGTQMPDTNGKEIWITVTLADKE